MNIQEAKKNLAIAWNHFQYADAAYIHAAIMELNYAESMLKEAIENENQNASRYSGI